MQALVYDQGMGATDSSVSQRKVMQWVVLCRGTCLQPALACALAQSSTCITSTAADSSNHLLASLALGLQSKHGSL
jgi:hypothetical protein